MFLGAGASATTADAPTGAQLADRLASELDPSEAEGCSTLGDMAGRLEAKIGRYELIQLVGQAFESAPATTPEFHIALSRLPVKTFVTTNYDLFMERALSDAGVNFQRLCSPTDISHISSDKTVLLKLHGSLDVEEALAPLIVTTHDFYEHFVAGGSVAQDLLKAWLLSKTSIFIGFGLRDPNFLHLFYYVRSLISSANLNFQDRMFAIQQNPNPLDVQSWSRRGISVINCDAAEFVDSLSELLLAKHIEIHGEERRIVIRPECPLTRVPMDLIRELPGKFGHHHRFIVLSPSLKRQFPEAPERTWIRLVTEHHSEYVQIRYDSRVPYGVAMPKQLRTLLDIPWDNSDIPHRIEGRVARDHLWNRFIVSSDAYIGRPSMSEVDDYYDGEGSQQLPMLQLRPYEFARLGLEQGDVVEVTYADLSVKCAVRTKIDDSINSVFISSASLALLGLADVNRSRNKRAGDVIIRRIVDNE
ncbi:SIR2 family protein [Kribbella sp. NBC_01484]|uniref:SIR2 family protein n=1 Tax=Kribbella sp. NBC_01484 TaxID=2903579 RepID=UPI002E346F2B|nr:SIR2 family protein [Kribbella sp. NBC_01484]